MNPQTPCDLNERQRLQLVRLASSRLNLLMNQRAWYDDAGEGYWENTNELWTVELILQLLTALAVGGTAAGHEVDEVVKRAARKRSGSWYLKYLHDAR